MHVIMYSYYFGTVYFPKLKSNIFIKKSITQMQIVSWIYLVGPWGPHSSTFNFIPLKKTMNFPLFQIQFIIMICHSGIPLFHGECDYPKSLLIFSISQNLIMLLLFLDFYYSAYVKPKRIKAKSNWSFASDQKLK